jgi:hypothetical protein
MAVARSVLREWRFGDGTHGDWIVQTNNRSTSITFLFGDGDGIAMSVEEARDLIDILESAVAVIPKAEKEPRNN